MGGQDLRVSGLEDNTKNTVVSNVIAFTGILKNKTMDDKLMYIPNAIQQNVDHINWLESIDTGTLHQAIEI